MKEKTFELERPIHLEFVLVQEGEFLMGSDPQRDKWVNDSSELPQHAVYAPDFYISKYPITNLQYAAFLRANPLVVPPDSWRHGAEEGSYTVRFGDDWSKRWKIPLYEENCPLSDCHWSDTIRFCQWLNAEAGRHFRVPSEVEWEKAARGTDGRIYPWGDSAPIRGMCAFNHHPARPAPIDSYPDTSPYGVVGMSGNVWEWTCSNFDTYPIHSAPDMTFSSVSMYVLRGGDCSCEPYWLRCAARGTHFPGSFQGFRVVTF